MKTVLEKPLVIKKNRNIVLALHSSTETLGVACMDLRETPLKLKKRTFPLGRDLSNSLLSCINEVCPYENWKQLARLAVATGPGGFTGTRLTIVMARTLAQQIACPLDGISSFALMATRLSEKLDPKFMDKPFWITQQLNRRGIVAGCYQLISHAKENSVRKALELEVPKLLACDAKLEPSVDVEEDVETDVQHLLELSLEAHLTSKDGNWVDVLPIYPTSPVDNS